MNDFNETSNAINSNFEERTSSMSDYSTSTTPNETQYQENTPTVTPEIVDAGTDVDLIDTNPVAVLAENFQSEPSRRPLAPGETNYTEEEARRVTEDLKVKLLHALEAQYDFTHAAERAFDGHIWVALGYPEGMKGWIAYCADNFAAEKIRVTGQQRTDLITGFTPGKISNRGIAALLGISRKTVDRTKAMPVSLPRKVECVTRQASYVTWMPAVCPVRNAARRSWNSPRKAPSRPTSPTCSTYPNPPCPTRSARTGCVA